MKSKLEREKVEIETRINGYLNRISKTTDDDFIQTYEQAILDQRKKKRSVEESLLKPRYTYNQFGTALNKILEVIKASLNMWNSEKYNDKKTILTMYFGEELEYDLNKGFGTASLAYPVNLIKVKDLSKPQNIDVEMSGSEPESE